MRSLSGLVQRAGQPKPFGIIPCIAYAAKQQRKHGRDGEHTADSDERVGALFGFDLSYRCDDPRRTIPTLYCFGYGYNEHSRQLVRLRRAGWRRLFGPDL
jgi:hypothetical protein